jgi:4-hydroxyacetophenone monooxygenase
VSDPIPSGTDDQMIVKALEEASLPALVPALVQLTGDESLLERYAPREPGRDVQGAGLSDDEERELRALALETLKALRDGTLAAPPPPPDKTLCRMMSWCAGEEVPSEYLPLAREEACLDGVDRRRLEWSRRPEAEALARFRVAIVGAGLGGLCAAIRLEQAGIPYTVIEKNHAVGGTWLENDYPDLRVDVPNHFYSYSFEPNPDWSDFYARRDELDAYIESCATRYGIRPHIRFDTEVTAATWDEDRALWKLELRDENGGIDLIEANVVISGVGMLNRPRVPALTGLERFEGACFHSSDWDHEVDLAGKRVAVIGTGASAMQIVPGIAESVGHLLVFQRSRHWALPNDNYHRAVGEGKRWLLRHMPHYLSWYRFLLFWVSADRIYSAFRVDPDWDTPEISISLENDMARRVMTEHIREELRDDPDLVEKVLPDYPPFGKRILQDNGWYRTLTRDNVDLVTEPIAEITPNGVMTRDGVEHPVDVLVLATGFHADRFLWPIEITGRGGTKLHDLWGENPRAYLGITVPEFPNLFCLYGPNTNPVVGSVIFMLECQVHYVTGCLREMLEGGIASMECRQGVHDEYNERVDSEHEKMVWRHPRVHSYYNNSKGRVITNAPWRLYDYWSMTMAPDLADYSLRKTTGLEVQNEAS